MDDGLPDAEHHGNVVSGPSRRGRALGRVPFTIVAGVPSEALTPRPRDEPDPRIVPILLRDGPAPFRLPEGPRAPQRKPERKASMSRASPAAQAEAMRGRGTRRTTSVRADTRAGEAGGPGRMASDPAAVRPDRAPAATRPRSGRRWRLGAGLSPQRPAPPQAPRRCPPRARYPAPPKPSGASPEAGSRAGRTTSRRRAR